MSAQDEDISKQAMKYIRPLRVTYEMESLIPEFELQNGDVCRREDVVFKNPNGKDMPGSLFRPKTLAPGSPVCIFSHGNAMNQFDSMNMTPIDMILEHGIAFCVFDLAGCGRGGEEFLGLGFREKDEIGCVIDHLKAHFGFQTIVLWGLSLGAFATLLATSERSDVAAAVIDSAWCTSLFKRLEDDLDKETLAKLRHYIQEKVHVDIYEFDGLEAVAKITIPMCFIVGTQDRLVPPENGKKLYDACASPKKTFLQFNGGHNAMRLLIMNDICRFIYESLGIEE